jgi:hypothetical protein
MDRMQAEEGMEGCALGKCGAGLVLNGDVEQLEAHGEAWRKGRINERAKIITVG